MLRGIALIAFVSVCTVLAGRASGCVRIAESDSLRQVAATVPPEDPEVREDVEERTGKDCEPEEERTARERKGFLRRIVREDPLIWDIYFTLQYVPVEELRLQKEEVIQARWVSFDQFRAYLKRGSVFRYPEIDEVLDAADGWLDDILGKETETS